MKIYLRKENKIIEEKDSKSLRFLYNTVIGRVVLKIIISKPISKGFGFLTNTKISKLFINNFVKKSSIDLSEYEDKKYKSFNDFFIREIKEEKRPLKDNKNIFPAVADSKLTVYKITKDLKLNIKNSTYDIEELIKDKKTAKEYENGMCLVFRLCKDDYHHYIYPDNGQVTSNYHINGVLHTVQPIALKKYKVFTENDREITILNTENFKEIIYIEVGALNIGKIHNNKKENFQKGEEKGYFSFGASTVILLLKEKTIEVDKDILKYSKEDIETRVLQKEQIGKK